jgi:hypothetical protein
MQVYQKNGRSCFDAIYLVSHSVNLDASFTPVKKMIDEMETGGYYDHFDEAVIRKLFDEHVAHVAYQKKHGHKKIHQVVFCFDDIVDDPKLRYSPVLQSILIRGRHIFCSSAFTSQQKNKIPVICRVNFSDWFIWSIHSRGELAQLIEEHSALVPAEELYQAYKNATDVKYGFLWVNKRDRTFHLGLGPIIEFSR